MSDWTRIRKRLKDNKTPYKKIKNKYGGNFKVKFGEVTMIFTPNDEILVGIQIFDLFENSMGNMIRHWSNG